MIKNQSNIYRFPMQNALGKGVTGLAPTVKISKDGGAFVASTNSVTEPDTTNAPGLYQLILTAEECNCNQLTLVVNVSTGEWGAIFNEFEMISPSSGITAADVWNYNQGRTLTNIQTELSTYGAAKTSELPNVSGLATASALSAVATTTDGIKAKTDNLPATPAAKSDVPSAADNAGAVWSASARTLTSSPTDISSLATSADISALALHGNTYWMTASGFSTPSNVSTAAEAIINALPSDYAKPSDIPTPPSVAQIWEAETRTLTDSPDIQTELETYGAAKASDIPTVSDIQDGLATAQGLEDVQTHGDEHWSTDDLNFDISSENREAIAKDVWEYTPRCLTFEPNPSVYCSRSDIERRWGVNNVRQWADLENDNNAARIQMQIDWAILAASERINSDLAASVYKLPFDPVPYAVRRFAATLAGVELFNTRAVNISREQSNGEIRTALADYSNWITSVLSNVPIVGATLK